MYSTYIALCSVSRNEAERASCGATLGDSWQTWFCRRCSICDRDSNVCQTQLSLVEVHGKQIMPLLKSIPNKRAEKLGYVLTRSKS